MSKHEEKLNEKSPEEKWQRDPLGLVIWAILLIWIGLLFFASRVGWLNHFLAQLKFATAESPLAAPVAQLSVWSLAFTGASIILFAEVVLRILFPAYRRPVLGTTILALILLGIGLNNWILIWPVVILVIGLAFLYRAFPRKK